MLHLVAQAAPTELLAQYGVVGVTIGAFLWYLARKDKDDREERADREEADRAEREKMATALDNNARAYATMSEVIRKCAGPNHQA